MSKLYLGRLHTALSGKRIEVPGPIRPVLVVMKRLYSQKSAGAKRVPAGDGLFMGLHPWHSGSQQNYIFLKDHWNFGWLY
jgi:hypothetical protein